MSLARARGTFGAQIGSCSDSTRCISLFTVEPTLFRSIWPIKPRRVPSCLEMRFWATRVKRFPRVRLTSRAVWNLVTGPTSPWATASASRICSSCWTWVRQRVLCPLARYMRNWRPSIVVNRQRLFSGTRICGVADGFCFLGMVLRLLIKIWYACLRRGHLQWPLHKIRCDGRLMIQQFAVGAEEEMVGHAGNVIADDQMRRAASG